MEVTLLQMLAAREARAERQRELIGRFGRPVVSFSMNIPGPVKDSAIIRRGFLEGCASLDRAFEKSNVLFREIYPAVTGWEALYVLDQEPGQVKATTTAIEDSHGLGRLFDMDVILPDGKKIDRETVGGGSRDCIVCGAPGRGCASRRLHSVQALQEAVQRILKDHFQQEDICRIGKLAVRSLLEEVCTTPKPGLVDRRNTGSHRDMDLAMFHRSAEALEDYFAECARIGMETAGEKPEDTFPLLRKAGLQAEKAMYAVTNGVNTHKGVIFTIGILCGAAGRLWTGENNWNLEAIFREVSSMTRQAMEKDWATGGNTVGHLLYAEKGIRGIRGQVADGLPAVAKIGLPIFRDCLKRGVDRNEAGVRTLLHLIAQVEDTNMISRGGYAGAREAVEEVKSFLERDFSLCEVQTLDDWFISRNLSPGGCADLLAAVYFLDSLVE